MKKSLLLICFFIVTAVYTTALVAQPAPADPAKPVLTLKAEDINADKPGNVSVTLSKIDNLVLTLQLANANTATKTTVTIAPGLTFSLPDVTTPDNKTIQLTFGTQIKTAPEANRDYYLNFDGKKVLTIHATIGDASAPAPAPVVGAAPATVPTADEIHRPAKTLAASDISDSKPGTVKVNLYRAKSVALTLKLTNDNTAAKTEVSVAAGLTFALPAVKVIDSKTIQLDFADQILNITDAAREYYLTFDGKKVLTIQAAILDDPTPAPTPAPAPVATMSYLPDQVKDDMNKGCIACADKSIKGYKRQVYYHLWYSPVNPNEAFMRIPDKITGKGPFTRDKAIYNPRRLHAHEGWPFTFELVNINPYKYSIYVSSSTVNHNEEDVSIVTNAIRAALGQFAPSPAASLTGTGGPCDDKCKARLKAEVVKMGKDLLSYMDEIKNEDDDDIDMQQLQKDHVLILTKVMANFNSLDIQGLDDLNSFNLPEKIKAVLGKLDGDKDSTAIAGALTIYNQFRKVSFGYSYPTPPVPNRDAIIYRINVHPKDTTQNGIRMVDQPFYIPIKGGFKIDASLGIFYSGLHNNNYYGQADSFTTVAPNGKDVTVHHGNRVVGDRSNVTTINLPNKKTFSFPNGEFGAMALVHFYSRLSRNFNIAFSGGVGMSIDKSPEPRGLVGASLLFGRENRFGITGGAIFGPVQRLASQYSGPGLYTASSGYTVQKVEANAFLGISYNFNLTTKKNTNVNGGDGTTPPAASNNNADKTGGSKPGASTPPAATLTGTSTTTTTTTTTPATQSPPKP